MKAKPQEEPSEIKAELLALTGSTAGYEALLDNLGEQLRTLAHNGHRINMKGNKVISVSIPARKQSRRAAG